MHDVLIDYILKCAYPLCSCFAAFEHSPQDSARVCRIGANFGGAKGGRHGEAAAVYDGTLAINHARFDDGLVDIKSAIE
jgi:hypothetical protein